MLPLTPPHTTNPGPTTAHTPRLPYRFPNQGPPI